MELLERTTHSSHCPYNGDVSYYSNADRRGVFGRAIVDRLHCVGGIDDQIENDLLKLHAIAFDLRQ